MAAESKVQKVARGAARMQKTAGTCECGKTLLWVIYAPQKGRPRMRKYCGDDGGCFKFKGE